MLNRVWLPGCLVVLLAASCRAADFDQGAYPLPPATQALATLLARGIATSDRTEYPPPIPGPLAPPPATITPDAQANPYPLEAEDPETGTPIAVQTARGYLAGHLSLLVRQIKLVSWQKAEWITSNLGCQPAAVFDLQNPVPGYLILLQAGGQSYELHSDQVGEDLCLAQSLRPGETISQARDLTSDTAAELAQLHLVSRLGLLIEAVRLDRVDSAHWEQDSLDCPSFFGQQPGAASNPIPGYRIILSTQENLYEFHSSSSSIVYCGALR